MKHFLILFYWLNIKLKKHKPNRPPLSFLKSRNLPFTQVKIAIATLQNQKHKKNGRNEKIKFFWKIPAHFLSTAISGIKTQ